MTNKTIFIEVYKRIKELNLENPNEKKVQEIFCKFLIINWDEIISHLSVKYDIEAEDKLYMIFNTAMNFKQTNSMLYKASHILDEYKNTVNYTPCMQHTLNY